MAEDIKLTVHGRGKFGTLVFAVQRSLPLSVRGALFGLVLPPHG